MELQPLLTRRAVINQWNACHLLSLFLMISCGCNSQTSETGVKNDPLIETHSTDLREVGEAQDDARPQTSINFVDVAAPRNLVFAARTGRDSEFYSILESLGSGISFCDFDADSLPDLAIPGGGLFGADKLPTGLPVGLFRQTVDRNFHICTDNAKIPLPDFYLHGINVGDFDNDGFSDLIATGFHGMLILHNQGDGTFRQVSCGLPATRNVWSTSSAFLDLNNDGNLDLYIVNYVDLQPGEYGNCIVKGRRDVCPPGEYAASSDELLLNNGDGTFREWSSQAGLLDGGKGLAIAAGDIDQDGDCDVYVANDTTANFLYVNDGAGRLLEQGLISGSALGATAEAEGSMGVEFADFNGDQRADIWVSNYENQSFALYENRGPGIFQHVSAVRGITAVGQMFVGFGTAALDADLDGDLDIMATNGHVMYHSTNSPRQQTPLLFENTDHGVFRNVAKDAGDYTSSTHEGRGLAVADFDSDGRPDVAISHCEAPVALLLNQSRTNRKPIAVRLIGRYCNRDATGAVVTIVSGSQPGQRSVSLQKSGGSYLSSTITFHYFTVPQTDDDDSFAANSHLEVLWPTGRKTAHSISSEQPLSIIEPLVSIN